MGTVGLSFGSPTSGTGFNVSSTVAEIVSNLQNVETPWKNQLTTLETQDTAISSLGTLFSNLSNDMSSLTDFQGILAQKEGSSSDNNVLQLTAASSSATAGTHSVVVKNLAQTSSGYLDEITNSSDALSGSISIRLGNGTTENVVIGAAPTQPAANTIYTGSGVNTLFGSRFRHQLRKSRTHSECAHRFHGLPAESRLRNRWPGRTVNRHIVAGRRSHGYRLQSHRRAQL